jgi:hypothetical protein
MVACWGDAALGEVIGSAAGTSAIRSSAIRNGVIRNNVIRSKAASFMDRSGFRFGIG